MKVVIAYIPVIHAGHEVFFKKHKPDIIYILGRGFVSEFPRMDRDMRALSDDRIKSALSTYGYASDVRILDSENIVEAVSIDTIVMPDEDITRDFAEKNLQGKNIEFDTVFLRWHQMNSITKLPPNADAIVSTEEFDRRIMVQAGKEAKRSSDWWRQIGVVVVKNGNILFSGYNEHQPSERAAYIHGDPRSNFDAGQQPEIYTSVHAEAGIVAAAAKKGVSLEGADLYVTTFPCPNCAKLLSKTGISTVYYRYGYSVLDAEDVLKASGIKLIRVEV